MREIPQSSDRVALAAGEVLFRDLQLAEGDFLHAMAWQEGVDVAWRLRAANGEVLLIVDSPNGRFGLEELLFLAPSDGTYRLELEAAASVPTPGTGCRIEIDPPRTATDPDATWVAADRHLRDGRRRLKEGAAREALERLDLALEIFSGLPASFRERKKADAMAALAEAEEALGLYEPALAHCQGVLLRYRESGDLHQLPLLFARAGLLELRLGRVGAARAALARARSLAQEQGDEVALAKALATLGATHRLLGDRAGAEQSFAEAAGVIARLRQPELEAELLYERGTAHLAWGDPAAAGVDYLRAEELWKGAGHDDQLPAIWIGLAEAAGDRGEYASAETLLTKALEALEAQGRWRDGAVAWFARAELYRKQRRYDESWAAYEEARGEADEVGDPRTSAIAQLGAGHCRHQLGEPEAGLTQMLEARQALAQLGDPVMERRALVRAAEALRTLGRPEEATALEIAPLLASDAAETAARFYDSIEDPDPPPAPVIVARTGLPGNGKSRGWDRWRRKKRGEYVGAKPPRPEATDEPAKP